MEAIDLQVIDERLARRFWGDGDPVGRRLFSPLNANQLSTLGPATPWLTVVGVVRSARRTPSAS